MPSTRSGTGAGHSSDGKTYKWLAKKQKSILLKSSRHYEVLQETVQSDEVRDAIRSYVGKCQLILTKKFGNFEQMCNRNIAQKDDEPFKVLPDDLAAMWELIAIDLESLKKSRDTIEGKLGKKKVLAAKRVSGKRLSKLSRRSSKSSRKSTASRGSESLPMNKTFELPRSPVMATANHVTEPEDESTEFKETANENSKKIKRGNEMFELARSADQTESTVNENNVLHEEETVSAQSKEDSIGIDNQEIAPVTKAKKKAAAANKKKPASKKRGKQETQNVELEPTSNEIEATSELAKSPVVSTDSVRSKDDSFEAAGVQEPSSEASPRNEVIKTSQVARSPVESDPTLKENTAATNVGTEEDTASAQSAESRVEDGIQDDVPPTKGNTKKKAAANKKKPPANKKKTKQETELESTTGEHIDQSESIEEHEPLPPAKDEDQEKLQQPEIRGEDSENSVPAPRRKRGAAKASNIDAEDAAAAAPKPKSRRAAKAEPKSQVQPVVEEKSTKRAKRVK